MTSSGRRDSGGTGGERPVVAAGAVQFAGKRDAQRMRIHVALDQLLDKPLPTGARATVQLRPQARGPFARTFAGLQIHRELVAPGVY